MIFSRQLPVVPVIVFVLTPIMAGIEAHAGTPPAWASDSTSVIAATQGPGLEADAGEAFDEQREPGEAKCPVVEGLAVDPFVAFDKVWQ